MLFSRGRKGRGGFSDVVCGFCFLGYGVEVGFMGSNWRWCGEWELGLLEEFRGRGFGGVLGSFVLGFLLVFLGIWCLVDV